MPTESRTDLQFSYWAGCILAIFVCTGNVTFPIGNGSQITIAFPLMLLAFIVISYSVDGIYFFSKLVTLFLAINIAQFVFGIPAHSSYYRIILGTGLIIFFIFICSELLNYSALSGHRGLLVILPVMLWCQIGLQIILIFYFATVGTAFQPPLFFSIPRSAGFAAEPSHVAIVLAPYVFIAAVTPQSYRRIMGRHAYLGLGLSIFFLGASATGILVVVLAAMMALMRKRRGTSVVLAIVVIFAVISAAVYFTPFLRVRIFTTVLLLVNGNATGTENLSALVFLKGLDFATIALQRFPLGVGILNLASLAPFSTIARLSPTLETLNNDDGSSLLFKGVGEFGILYILLLVLVVFQIRRRWKFVDTDDIALLEASFLFTVLATMIRDATYFDSAAMIGIALTLRRALSFRWSVRLKLDNQSRLDTTG